jgi:hypothetical protein
MRLVVFIGTYAAARLGESTLLDVIERLGRGEPRSLWQKHR